MAGPAPNPTFEANFRAGIAKAMMMGLQPDPALRPIFHFDGYETYDSEDSSSRPWDWTAEPTNDAPPEPIVGGNEDGQVLVAVEGREGETDETTAGTFEADEYLITALDLEWQKIELFTWVELGGKRFRRGKQVVMPGIFPIGIHQVRVEADPDA